LAHAHIFVGDQVPPGEHFAVAHGHIVVGQHGIAGAAAAGRDRPAGCGPDDILDLELSPIVIVIFGEGSSVVSLASS
jgi:hypothetical protein